MVPSQKKKRNKIVPGKKKSGQFPILFILNMEVRNLYQQHKCMKRMTIQVGKRNVSMTIIISATNILEDAFQKVFNDDSLTNTHPLVHLFILLTKTIVIIITTILTMRSRPYITQYKFGITPYTQKRFCPIFFLNLRLMCDFRPILRNL